MKNCEIVAKAKEMYECEDIIIVDKGNNVDNSPANGAWVKALVWVSFD